MSGKSIDNRNKQICRQKEKENGQLLEGMVVVDNNNDNNINSNKDDEEDDDDNETILLRSLWDKIIVHTQQQKQNIDIY